MPPIDSDLRSEKSPDAFRTITEVADLLDVQQHVLRFWETKFTQIKPMKRAGGRRYYRPDDVRLLEAIRVLLHEEGYTIRGVQKILRENGVKAVLDGAASASQAAQANEGASGPEESDPRSSEQDQTPLNTDAAEQENAVQPGLLDGLGAEPESIADLEGLSQPSKTPISDELRTVLASIRGELIEIRASLQKSADQKSAPIN